MKRWIPCGALCLSLFPTVAFGQSTQEYKEDSEEEVPTSLTADSEDGGLEDATAPEVMGPRPPTVLDAVSVDAPESMELTEPMSVELSVVVEADGSVSEVDVLEGDSSLGEIAQDAMRRFVFRPAQLADGTTARARIRYRFDFAPPPPPAAGALLIEVRDALDQPVVGATVRVTGQENTPMIADFDSPSGTFRYVELPVGTYRVEVTADGYAATRSTETVDEHVETAVILRLTGELALEEVSGNADEPVFGETAVVEAPPREVLRRSISGRAAASVAGTRGDALRAVEVMPGVARPPFGSGQLILRGSAPADSQVFLDGVPVPLLYHFGGLTSFLPSPLVDRIDFFPSNFSVRYGRRIGGVVEVRARPPRTDGFHFAADLNAVDTSLLLETPLGTWGSVAAGFRQSLIGYWLTPLLDGAGTSNISAPVYQDYQVIGLFRLSSSDELILRSYGSRDGFAFTSTEPEDENPFEVGRSSLTSDFDRVDLTWKRQYSQGSAHEITVAGGSRRERFQLGEAQRTVTEVFDLVLRAEFQQAISDRFNLRLGADMIVAPYEIELFGPPPGASEGAFESPEFDTIDVTTDGLMMRPAAYAELDIYPVEELQLILGLRADYFGTLEQLTFDPRVAAIYSVTDRFRLKAGVGMFSQAPELVESDELLGNPDLGAIRAVHSAIGFEADVGEYLRLGTEGFFKHLYNRVVQSTESGEGFVNNGIGRIYGFEVSAMLNATEGDPNDPRSRQGPIGFLNYTLSRSERSDQGGPWRLFDFDQTHLLTASAGYQLRGGWRFSALFRLASGNPITPAERGIYDVAADQYRPVYGTLNSDRAGFFHRLDVRFEKQWLVEPISLTFYVDIQNVYNRQNPESRNYNYNFTESSTSNGLPIIPSIGLRGEM